MAVLKVKENNEWKEIQAIKGDAGPANTLSIGTVTKGTDAAATITGTAPNQTLNLTLPKGDKGDRGDTGSQGPAGTTDYTDMTNKPSINSVTLSGNKTSSDLGLASSNDLSSETSARQNADTNLQNQIDAITVSTDVVDVLGTYTDLQNYDTSKLTADDIVKVLQDSTHSNAMSYYKWTITQGTGAWSYVGSEGPFYTKSESDTLLQAKANTADLSRIATTGAYADLLNNPQELLNVEYETSLTTLFNDILEEQLAYKSYIVGNDFVLNVEMEAGDFPISLYKGDSLYISADNYGTSIFSSSGMYYLFYDGEAYWHGGYLPNDEDVYYMIDDAISQLDLSGYVDKTSNETISGVKTIQNADGLKFHLPSSNMSSSITPLNEGMSLNYISGDYTVQKLILGRLRTTTVQDIIPSDDNTIDLGKSDKQFKDVYIKGNLSDGTNSTSVANINNNFAPTYDATATYNLGDRCVYQGRLYKCSTAITTAEAWDATHWTATSVDDLIGNIDSALTGLVSGGGVQ